MGTSFRYTTTDMLPIPSVIVGTIYLVCSRLTHGRKEIYTKSPG